MQGYTEDFNDYLVCSDDMVILSGCQTISASSLFLNSLAHHAIPFNIEHICLWLMSTTGSERMPRQSCCPFTCDGDGAALRCWHSAHSCALRVSAAMATLYFPVHHVPGWEMLFQARRWAVVKSSRTLMGAGS